MIHSQFSESQLVRGFICPKEVHSEHWHWPVLLTLSDPRDWVLTLTDTRGREYLHCLYCLSFLRWLWFSRWPNPVEPSVNWADTTDNNGADSVSPLESRGNHSATLNNMKLLHWPLMGGLLHLVTSRMCGPFCPAFISCCYQHVFYFVQINMEEGPGQSRNHRIV